MKKIVLGVLASTMGTDLQCVIDAIEKGELEAKIACVVSNKQDAFVFERAKKHNIEAIFLDPKKFDSKEEFDSKLVKLLNERNVSLVLLIGYNKFLTTVFLEAFKNRVVNIHPSLLPAFKGWYKDVYKRILAANVKETGCTLLFLDNDPDAGPIILQKAVPVLENDDLDSLKKRVQKAEQEVILKGLKLFQAGKLHVEGKRVYIVKD